MIVEKLLDSSYMSIKKIEKVCEPSRAMTVRSLFLNCYLFRNPEHNVNKNGLI